MENNKRFLLAMMLLPWLTFPFLGKKAVKRFSITSLFIGVVVVIESLIAHKRGWWRIYERLHPKIMGELPFIVGPFYIGAIWILKFTFGKFLRYSFLNLGIDTFHIYVFVKWLKSMGIVSLIRLKNYQALMMFTFNALIMYGFQLLIDKKVNPKRPTTVLKRIFS